MPSYQVTLENSTTSQHHSSETIISSYHGPEFLLGILDGEQGNSVVTHSSLFGGEKDDGGCHTSAGLWDSTFLVLHYNISLVGSVMDQSIHGQLYRTTQMSQP